MYKYHSIRISFTTEDTPHFRQIYDLQGMTNLTKTIVNVLSNIMSLWVTDFMSFSIVKSYINNLLKYKHDCFRVPLINSRYKCRKNI